MVRVGVQRKSGAEGVVSTLVRSPQKGIAFEIKWGLEALRLIEGFREKEYDGHILRGICTSVIRMLISDQDARKLVQSCTLAIFARIRSEMEGELEIWSREVDTREHLFTYGIISRLLCAFPRKTGFFPRRSSVMGLVMVESLVCTFGILQIARVPGGARGYLSAEAAAEWDLNVSEPGGILQNSLGSRRTGPRGNRTVSCAGPG